jgi:6,7-dimethyl-8-ribityllumazine synthase
MSVQLQTSCPIVYGVLNCLNDEQVKARSTGNNNHGEDWGKTAVEMACLRNEALNIKGQPGKNTLLDLGFGKATPLEQKEKKVSPGFF